MKIQETLAEGKTKKIYATDETDQLIMEFLDVIPQETSKKATLKGKGAINAAISAYLFDYLGSYNVPTHFIKQLDDNSLVVKKLDMIPFKMVIWNLACDSLAKRLGLKDGTVLETPVLELYLKNAKLKNPLINDYHAYALGLCDRSEMGSIVRIATKVNAVLKSFFYRKKLTLANFELEFGKSGSQVLMGDELSPDTFTVWDDVDTDKMDKKPFQITPEAAKTVYPKLHERLLK
ncbi:MAG: phosphoribosylaminoimidazolesuccinocarboxamide synthase [Calditrichia bacterium]